MAVSSCAQSQDPPFPAVTRIGTPPWILRLRADDGAGMSGGRSRVYALSRSNNVRATTFVARRRSSSTMCSSARFAFDSSTVRGPAP